MNSSNRLLSPNTSPDLTADQIEAGATWIRQGRDAYLSGENICPFMPFSIAGRAWEHGWMLARRAVRGWAAEAVA
jgi:hypothetical protein